MSRPPERQSRFLCYGCAADVEVAASARFGLPLELGRLGRDDAATAVLQLPVGVFQTYLPRVDGLPRTSRCIQLLGAEPVRFAYTIHV